MNDVKMNRQLGTKWFTFYTKVRPWLFCLSAASLISDFAGYTDLYFDNWWLMLYFIGIMVQAVLGIFVFIKSKADYGEFVRFVKGVLIFEVFNIAYGQGMQQYIDNSFDLGAGVITAAVVLVLLYFIWYRLMLKYFKRRLLTGKEMAADVSELPYFPSDSQRAGTIGKEGSAFCRSCGAQLPPGSRFCRRCGAEVISLTESGDENK